jgi:hypothetical protein
MNHAPRHATLRRETAETQIDLSLSLDGNGIANVATGVGFFDHMLTHIARHGLFDLTVTCQGDLHIDAHHTVEVQLPVIKGTGQGTGFRRQRRRSVSPGSSEALRAKTLGRDAQKHPTPPGSFILHQAFQVNDPFRSKTILACTQGLRRFAP